MGKYRPEKLRIRTLFPSVYFEIFCRPSSQLPTLDMILAMQTVTGISSFEEEHTALMVHKVWIFFVSGSVKNISIPAI